MIPAAMAGALLVAGGLIVLWQVRADNLADENWELRFAAIRVAADMRRQAAEHDQLLRRYADLLDEHALCPVPLTLAAPAVSPLHLVAVDESDWPTMARQVEDETS